MAISAKFVADFADFQSAVSAAQSKLVSFETGAGKVQAALGRMETSLSGRKLIQDATLMAQAVENIGGPAKLTATELQKLGSQAQAAADKMARMGLDVPPGLQAIATAAQKAEAGQKTLGQTVEGGSTSHSGSWSRRRCPPRRFWARSKARSAGSSACSPRASRPPARPSMRTCKSRRR